VADIRWLGRFARMRDFMAWGMWLGVHILYLIGFANGLSCRSAEPGAS
jgi:hypothetical protein